MWIGAFTFQERIVPRRVALQCNWPALDIDASLDSTKVLLVADPQLIDNHTYPGRNEFLLSLSKHTVDMYLKRNYKSFVHHLEPDYIVFLGDYLDNARDSADTYFYREKSRFDKIFVNPFSYKQNVDLFLNTPGNHDIGFGDGVNLAARERFVTNFGAPNAKNSIAGVDFISVDALSYSSENTDINKDVNEFINSFKSDNPTPPRVLLSHIPLYRDPSKDCGPLRESDRFPGEGFGYQYKNSIEQSLSQTLIESIKPSIIFSGDDHDYCEITHDELELLQPKEFTVKSISMAMGIQKPAVQLLTFNAANSNFKYSTKLCYLQTPYLNIKHYILLSVLTVLFLFFWNYQRSSRQSYNTILPMNIDDYRRPSVNSKKISNFLKEQEDEAHDLSSYYLHSSTLFGALPSKLSVKNTYLLRLKQNLAAVTKKYSLVLLLKQCLLFTVAIVALYYFGFSLTA